MRGIGRCAVAGWAAAVLWVAAAPAWAEGLLRLRAGAAQTNYGLSFEHGPYQGKSAQSRYSASAMGLSYVSEGRYLMDVLVQSSLSGQHDLWTTPQSFSRQDVVLTGAYRFSTGVSLFGGYRTGSTELAAAPGMAIAKDTFDTSGMFAGIAYGLAQGRGQFGVNVALASMTGTWSDDAGYTAKAAQTMGFSAGASYTYMFSHAFGLTLDAKGQSYSYQFPVPAGTGVTYYVYEKVSSVGLYAVLQF